MQNIFNIIAENSSDSDEHILEQAIAETHWTIAPPNAHNNKIDAYQAVLIPCCSGAFNTLFQRKLPDIYNKFWESISAIQQLWTDTHQRTVNIQILNGVRNGRQADGMEEAAFSETPTPPPEDNDPFEDAPDELEEEEQG